MLEQQPGSPSKSQYLAALIGPFLRGNLILAAVAFGAAGSIFEQFSVSFLYLLFLGAAFVLATTALVGSRSTRCPPANGKSRAGLVVRAVLEGTLWGILALAVICRVIYPVSLSPWSAHATDWGTMTFFACLVIAQAMTVVALCRDRGHATSRCSTIARGIAAGMLAAPAAIEAIEALRWPVVKLLPFPLLATGWALGCAVGGALIALLLRHWRELICERCGGSPSELAGRGLAAFRRFINSPFEQSVETKK